MLLLASHLLRIVWPELTTNDHLVDYFSFRWTMNKPLQNTVKTEAFMKIISVLVDLSE